jgi:hypothetical protein
MRVARWNRWYSFGYSRCCILQFIHNLQVSCRYFHCRMMIFAILAIGDVQSRIFFWIDSRKGIIAFIGWQ